MTASTGNVPGRIFMSYRREDAAYPAGWLYDRLVGHFDRNQVFKDINSIELGDDFVEVITAAVGSCDVLLALIGDRWLTVTGQDGRRRLDDPGDFVRLEIEVALTRNVRVIPILVEGARMPRADELPESLANLVRRQALELSSSRFDVDTGRLLGVLERAISEAQEQAHQQAEAKEARRRHSPDSIRADAKRAALMVSIRVQWADQEVRQVDKLRDDEQYWVIYVLNSSPCPLQNMIVTVSSPTDEFSVDWGAVEPGAREWYILRPPDSDFPSEGAVPEVSAFFEILGIKWQLRDGKVYSGRSGRAAKSSRK